MPGFPRVHINDLHYDSLSGRFNFLVGIKTFGAFFKEAVREKGGWRDSVKILEFVISMLQW